MYTFLHTLRTGFAIFSMFFGAGNLIYPLAVGYFAGDKYPIATLGFLISAVLIPFCGLIAIILYNGDTRSFFGRMGSVPGLIVSCLILALLGPLGVTPRCISLAFRTLQLSFPELSLTLFSAMSCILIFFCTWRKRRMISLLGYLLTPVLLASLLTIIFAGLWNGPAAYAVNMNSFQLFKAGITEGYYTMDLLSAFFIGSVVIRGIREESGPEKLDQRTVARKTVQGGLLGIAILSLVYVGFSLVASRYAPILGPIDPADLLGSIALQTLGYGAATVVAIANSLACLTTAIAMVSVFADALRDATSLPNSLALALTLALTFVISLLEVSGIMAFLAPLLQMCYPMLIILTLVNIGLWLRPEKKEPVFYKKN